MTLTFNQLKRFLLGFILLSFMISYVAHAAGEAEGEKFIAGKHFTPLSSEVLENPLVERFKQEGEGKIQVIEFFSYGCSWCYKLDPYLENWRKALPSDIVFQRIPVEFLPAWRTLSKAFYTALNLNAMDTLHSPLFKAIHTDEITDSSELILKNFFISKGISSKDFDSTFDSFSVNRKYKWANAISKAYRITAIPVMLVQGPTGSYFTSVRLAGGQERLIEVLDYLIQQEHLASNKQ